ncbi:MAG TPA: TlpA disulfide reductase family protein [Thermoanaerobaculia bacterium]
MLAQEVVKRYGSRARYVVEDLGASPIARRFGVDKYPAIFVDQSLVARPEDFYAWGGPETGKYLPWKDLANRRRFQADLQKMIDLRLAGETVPSLQVTRSAKVVRSLPSLPMTDLQGRRLTFAQLRGKPVLVELWATWCPPCLETMAWLKQLDPATVTVVAVAVESPRADVDKVVARTAPPGHVVIGTPELRAAFDGPPAVPTLVLADAEGRIAHVFYGAPKTLHADIERELGKLRR